MAQSQSKLAGHDLKFTIFVVLIIAANALLTFGFGMRFGQEIVPTGSEGLSKFLGGLMMTLFFDLAALGWFAGLRLRNQSPRQRAIARALGYGSMFASTLVSAIQLGLTTSLIDLSSSYSLIGAAGLGLVVFIAALHFIGVCGYFGSSVASQRADLDAEREASNEQNEIDSRRMIDDRTNALVQQFMLEELPALAEAEAALQVRRILSSYHSKPEFLDKAKADQTEDLTEKDVSESGLPQVDGKTEANASPTPSDTD
ncbi:MAG: hypothetical protein AAFQ01_04895, partial [Bacteroidota bacterium]